jgi:hypothetical protein
MNINEYIYSLVLYRLEEIPYFDVVVGVVAANFHDQEFMYEIFEEGMQIVEEYIGVTSKMDFVGFLEDNGLDIRKVDICCDNIVDVYMDNINIKEGYMLSEPFSSHYSSSSMLAMIARKDWERKSFLLSRRKARFDLLLID